MSAESDYEIGWDAAAAQYSTKIKELTAELAAVRERGARLAEACRHAVKFIENGIAIDRIQMPDEALDDPAWRTLPTLVAALAAWEGEK